VNKKLIIALVVIVVLFIAVVIMSASHGNKKPDDAGSLSALKGLQGNRFLVLGDKASTPCASAGQTAFFMNGNTCVITLEKRGLFSKSTRVVLTLPSNFVVVTAPKGQPTQTINLSDGGCFGTAISHSGGSLSLTGNGTVVIGSSPCPS
jgi:hypothetical protein